MLIVQLLIISISALWVRVLIQTTSAGGSISASNERLANYMLFFHQDLPVASVVSIFSLGILVLLWRGWQPRWATPTRALGWRGPALVAAFTFGACLIAGLYAHLGFDSALDEFMPAFQARIFAAGWLLAPIDPQWEPFAKALQPLFVHFDEARGLWASAYRPVHAMLRAAALLLGAEQILNPVLAAGSVLLMAHVVQRVFPDRAEAPLLAAVLLASSPQVIFMAASGYSFAAHLFFSLLWLSLFLRGDLVGHAAAALVGAIAIGMHQVHVHPLFAAPFLLAHLFGHYGRSLASLACYAVAYGIALPAWIAWPEIATAIQTRDLSVLPLSLRDTAYLRNYAEFSGELRQQWKYLVLPEMSTNLLRLAAWISPALLMLSLLALRRMRDLPLTVRLAGLGFVLMVAAHAVLMPYQFQGWGYRYVHPVLGNLVLLAVAAFPRAGPDRAKASVATVALVGLSLLVLMPWRFLQVEERIRPRAEAAAFIERLDAEVVLVDVSDIWFGVDLVHNDPFLRNRPLIMAAPVLSEALRAALQERRVVVVRPADLVPFGLGSGSWVEPVRQPTKHERR
ncbi:hypothetical protein [Neoroseomonas soli]|uniref:Uncharacterized protein n=1 Tax=Neoroseomonas soli TaxID=1081025 RepID=A0A9X9X4M0_9PROT|nr:hypothetical protein [Neoroseomonas soli]MBR0674349.1 hypothetical protein [Neoroseomonas soli]